MCTDFIYRYVLGISRYILYLVIYTAKQLYNFLCHIGFHTTRSLFIFLWDPFWRLFIKISIPQETQKDDIKLKIAKSLCKNIFQLILIRVFWNYRLIVVIPKPYHTYKVTFFPVCCLVSVIILKSLLIMCIKHKILLYLVNRISAINCNNVSKVFDVFELVGRYWMKEHFMKSSDLNMFTY